ncbi:MAG TPA: hypothetical protein VKA25_10405, partial [Gemmatimonadales bacterium]|nr:hypothetical protein [Gemmatimonadales bacterium]
MADPWRRYLAQQIELGGAEVVLSAGQRGSGAVTAPGVEPGEQTLAPLRRHADAWRKGAPPIPGPGISVESPPVTSALAELPTLDDVAERIRTTHCCALCPARINAVPGYGNPNARLVLVG